MTANLIERYLVYLHEQERSAHTIRKYAHDLNALYTYLDNVPLTKEALIEWKSRLADAFAPGIGQFNTGGNQWFFIILRMVGAADQTAQITEVGILRRNKGIDSRGLYMACQCGEGTGQ